MKDKKRDRIVIIVNEAIRELLPGLKKSVKKSLSMLIARNILREVFRSEVDQSKPSKQLDLFR